MSGRRCRNSHKSTGRGKPQPPRGLDLQRQMPDLFSFKTHGIPIELTA
jgi:hypothetical protein